MTWLRFPTEVSNSEYYVGDESDGYDFHEYFGWEEIFRLDDGAYLNEVNVMSCEPFWVFWDDVEASDSA